MKKTNPKKRVAILLNDPLIQSIIKIIQSMIKIEIHLKKELEAYYKIWDF